MNLKIYSNFDLNHPVPYFPFGHLYTFCMHGLTRKQPIRRLVLGEVISRSFLPEQSLTFCNISHDWKEDKFLYTMIYRLTIISFNYQNDYTGIYDKMHRLTREVDVFDVSPGAIDSTYKVGFFTMNLFNYSVKSPSKHKLNIL